MDDGDPRQAFAERLTLLWVEAGKPTYERLAREAQNRLAAESPVARRGTVTKQRISAWRTGKQVPRDFLPVSAVIGALVSDAKRVSAEPALTGLYSGPDWFSLWQRAVEATEQSRRGGGLPVRPPGDPDVTPRCPYLGLASFESGDARYYFGRASAIAGLTARVESVVDTGGMVVLVAPSGAGKSSLLAAGLVPAIGAGRLDHPGSAEWPIVTITPGSDPLAALAAHLPHPPADPTTLPSRAALRSSLAPHARLVLVVDQFEEVFTLCGEQERTLFVDTLDALATGPDAPAVVVLGLRSDVYGRCLDHQPLVEALQHRQVVLGPMSMKELTDAVTGPARAAGLRLEAHLADMIVADTGIRDGRSHEERESATGVLPLLSHALRATWAHRAHGVLTIAGYKAAGGIRGAVTQTAERTLADLDPPTRTAAMSLLLRLTRVGEEHSQDSRRLRSTEDLLTEASDPAAARRALDALVAARLVRVDADTTQIIHEALLTAWPRLRTQIDRHRVALLGFQRLEDDARHWAEGDHDPSRLYRGSELDDARRWAGSDDLGDAGPSSLALEFLAAATAEHDRQSAVQARRRRLDLVLRRATAVLAVFGLLVAVVAVAGWVDSARHEADARFAGLLAEADQLADTDPARAAQLNLVALRQRPGDPELEGRVLSTQHTAEPQVRPRPHGAVYFVDHSADGTLLATATEGGIVSILDRNDPAQPVLDEVTAGPSWLSTAIFNPARPLLATAGSEGIVRIWDVGDPRSVRSVAEIPIDHEEISQLAWSPDGRTLAVANGDHTLSLIDTLDGSAPVTVAMPGSGIVRAVVFSGRGDLVAAAGDDGRIATFRVEPDRGLALVDSVVAHQAPIQSLAFGPDDRVLASGSADKTVRLWSVDGGRTAPQGAPLSGHRHTIWSMVWSDAATLISGSADGTARIWNLANPELPSTVQTLPTATGGVLALDLAPDRQTLTGGGSDGTTLQWDLPTTVLTDNIARVRSVAVSPDRRWLATGAGSASVRLWDVRDPDNARRTGPLDIGSTDYQSSDMAFSADGRTLVTEAAGTRVRIWDVSSAGEVTLLSDIPQSDVYSGAVAVSPDGRHLVTGGVDGTLAVYDISDRARPVPLPVPAAAHRSYLIGATFIGDGDTLITSANDGTARLWDLSDPALIAPLGEPHDFGAGQIRAVALSPDDRIVAVASAGNSVVFWDRSDPDRVIPPLTGFDAPPTALAWSPDGTRLATGGADQVVRVWHDPLTADAAALPLTGHSGTVGAIEWLDDAALVSAGEDQLVLVWSLDLATQERRLCAATRGAFPADDPRFAYDAPCPPA